MLETIKSSKHQGPVVQSIVSLMSSLSGHLVKCLTTLTKYADIFLLKKMRVAKASLIFSTKNIHIFKI